MYSTVERRDKKRRRGKRTREREGGREGGRENTNTCSWSVVSGERAVVCLKLMVGLQSATLVISWLAHRSGLPTELESTKAIIYASVNS